MPRYRRHKHYKGFHNVHHLAQFLTRTKSNSKEWEYFQNAAKTHDQSQQRIRKSTISKISHGNPRECAHDVLYELKRHMNEKGYLYIQFFCLAEFFVLSN